MKVLGYITFTVLMVILGAFILTQLWGWFIVPFFGVSELTIPYALGITLTVRLIVPSSMPKKGMHEWETEEYLYATILPFLVWGMGYLVYLFI